MPEPASSDVDVVVIGGGLAGCAAAVHLSRAGHHVVVLEKRAAPEDRLCGEFLSVEVGAHLDRLGLLDAARAAGARSIRRTVVTAGRRRYERRLPGEGLGLSRRRLDALLIEGARTAGADVREGVAATGVDGDLVRGFTVATAEGAIGARLVLGAHGKRATLDRKLGRAFLSETVPDVAFKAHFTGPPPAGLVEVHAFPGGYCGLSEVEGGRTNVCWIGRSEVLRAGGGTPEAMLASAADANPHLAARLGRLERVSERYLAVSQVSLARKSAFERDVCMVGDAAGMIAPMCGDGMAMAFRSAELAAPRAAAFLDGALPAAAFRQAYAAAWRREFSLRLRLGRLLHAGIMQDRLARAALWGLSGVPAVGDWVIRQTRGPAVEAA